MSVSTQINQRSFSTQFLDFCLPRNPITGNRGLHIIPRIFERFIELSAVPRVYPPKDPLILIKQINKSSNDSPKKPIEEQINKSSNDSPEKKHIDDLLKVPITKMASLFQKRRIDTYKCYFVNQGIINAYSLGGNIVITNNLIQQINNEFDLICTSTDPDLPITTTNICKQIRTRLPTVQTASLETALNEPLSTEDIIAAVLAHEIVHSESRDSLGLLETTMLFNGCVTAIAYFGQVFLCMFYYKVSFKAASMGVFFGDFFKHLLNVLQKELVAVFEDSSRINRDIVHKIVKHCFMILTFLIIPFGAAFSFFLIHNYLRRQKERRCDLYAMALIKQAGYNPAAMVWFLKLLDKIAPSSHSLADQIFTAITTHPMSEDRLLDCARQFEKIQNDEIKIYGSTQTIVPKTTG